MKYRKLRIAWLAMWGLLTVLLLVLWVRSYWWIDVIDWFGSKTLISAAMSRGQFGSHWLTVAPPSLPPRFLGLRRLGNRITNGTQVGYGDGTGKPLPSYLGFKSSW